MAYNKLNLQDGDILSAEHLAHIENGIVAAEQTGATLELTVLKSFFTNIQTLISQLAFTTDDNVGDIVISNAQDIVAVIDNGSSTIGGVTITQNDSTLVIT